MMISLYDTTLRDGAQREGLSFSVADKLRILQLLDDFGVAYVEGGFPAANPKDAEFFERAGRAGLRRAKLVAFGSTRRAGTRAENDMNLRALVHAETEAVALVGKSSPLHVMRVLETTLDENVAMIEESVRFLKHRGREVVYDAEHFFDAYREDPAYAVRTVRAAADAGAAWVVLCDTNGGSLPSWVHFVTLAVGREISASIGVHTHDDGGLAVANALASVEAGGRMVQGTVNGYGERCGNANLVSLVPALAMKLGLDCAPAESLARLTMLSRTVSEIANVIPDPHAPYVGRCAFAHKGGLHVAAVDKVPESYEHVPPAAVGNSRRAVVSELSGRGNIRMRARELGIDVAGREAAVLAQVKALEHRGFQLEAAEGTVELLLRRAAPGYAPPFELGDVVVVAMSGDEPASEEAPTTLSSRATHAMHARASVTVMVAGRVVDESADGNGPVHALDRALRRALIPTYPDLEAVRLVDYKVRILDPDTATAATTRVLVEAACEGARWTTVGCSQNILEASCRALVDSVELFLARRQSEANKTHGAPARSAASM